MHRLYSLTLKLQNVSTNTYIFTVLASKAGRTFALVASRGVCAGGVVTTGRLQLTLIYVRITVMSTET